MQVRIKVGHGAENFGWAAVKIFGLVVVLSALVSSGSRGLVRNPAASAPKTVIPATIRASRVDTLTVSFGAKLKQILVSPGATVKAGQLLAVLESDDVLRSVEAARRRVSLATARVNVPRVAAGGPDVAALQSRTAAHSLELARQRSSDFSTGDAEAAYAAAQRRREKIAALAAQRMATDTEVAEAENQERNELRNLVAARERQSRLQQELEAAELQTAVLKSQATISNPDVAMAQTDLADAQAALNAALQLMSDMRLTAPHDGVVLSTTLAPGDRVFAGSPLLYVADVSRLSFEAPVSAALARQIHTGEPIRVRVPTDPPRIVATVVARVSMAPDPVQQNYLVRAVIGNPDRTAILVGMQGAIEFPHSETAWRRQY